MHSMTNHADTTQAVEVTMHGGYSYSIGEPETFESLQAAAEAWTDRYESNGIRSIGGVLYPAWGEMADDDYAIATEYEGWTKAEVLAMVNGVPECECSEECGPCERHGEVLAVREGSSTRTGDELLYVYVLDCFAILDQEPTPVAREVLEAVEADWEAQEDTSGCNWIEGDDTRESLQELANQMEATIGAWTIWDDGYRIVEPTNDCPLV